MKAQRGLAQGLGASGLALLLAAVWLAAAWAGATAFPASASAATAAVETVTPLPSSDYTVRAMCSPPATKRASCLALQLEPQTAEARARTHPLGVARARRRAPAAAPSPAAGYFGLRPQDLHSAYQLPSTAPGSQTIALVDAYNDPEAESDLKAYDEEFGLPECTAANGCFKQVNQNGETGNPPFPKTLSELETARKSSGTKHEAEEAVGWGLEISLDIEVAHATCQSCEILLTEADTPSYEDLEAAERSAADLGAAEISNSWSGPETGETPELESASPFNHPGIVIAAAAGDAGYLNWGGSAGERGQVGYPASSPHVVAVGGTRLTLGEHGEWSGEIVWNGHGATGGGCSSKFTAQPWQQSLANWSAVGCGSKRAVSDVAADADPFTGLAVRYTSSDCEYTYTEEKVKHVLHWCTIGGTSLATPLISAVYAVAGGADGVSYPAATLYENELASPASLHDVTSGSNGQCTKPFKGTGLSGCTVAEEAKSCSATAICVAGSGYDGPTGLGTPDGIAAFETPSSPPPPPPAPSVVTGMASSVTQTSATLAATVDPNGSEVKECKLEYGLTSEYGSSVACTPSPGSGDGAVAVSGSVSGLIADKTYHFRVLAVNAGGTSRGSDEAFATLPYAPAVVTGSASAVSQTAATLSGSVNPNGAEVKECKLEYGLSTAYEASVPCTPSPGSGESAVSVSGSVSDLAASQTYDFRVVAVNAGGTSHGGNQTFTTLASPPPPGPPEFGRCVKVVKGTGKYGNSKCTSLGGAADYEWEPGVSIPWLTTKSTSDTVVLEPQTGTKVTCTNAIGVGEYTGLNTVGGVVLTFTGCARGGEACASGAVAGEIASSSLEGVLGIEKLGASASKTKIGLDLFPVDEEAPVIMFSCGLATVSVTGSVIVPLATDKMVAAETLKFKATKGKQKPLGFVGGSEDFLQASLNGGAPVQLGLTMTSTLTSAEALEVNAVA